jgi:membrane protein DedA with SNARE-associated domain
MTPMSTASAVAFLGTWGYPAYFLLFLASAVGSPITEDLLLLIGGYLVGIGVFRWPITLGIALPGVLATDLLMYGIGRKIRAHALRSRLLRRYVRPGRLRLATRWFSRFGDRVVFFARLVPGTRLLVFVAAGLRGMPIGRFLAYDLPAALLWVPSIMWVGHHLGERFGTFEATLRWVGDRVLLLVLLVVAAYAARRLWRRWEQRNLPELGV